MWYLCSNHFSFVCYEVGSGLLPGKGVWRGGGGTPCTDKCDAGSLPKEGLYRWKLRGRESRQKAPQGLLLPQWAYESREKNSPGTGAAPPSRRRFPASGRSFAASVFPATKPDNPGIATDFTLCLQYRRRSKSVPCYTSAAAMGQLLRSGKPRRSNCFCSVATPATHFRQVTASRMRSAFPR